MPFHRCTISRPDGSVVVAGASLALTESGADGADWYGTLSVSPDASLVASQRYRITLDDGRAGECSVRRNTSAGELTRAVAIHGIGALK
jgi:hypothetical protein